MTVIDWGKNDVLKYLGSYFPRSYAEAYSLFSRFFTKHKIGWKKKTNIDVFDFGCGTGGQLIGMLTAIDKVMPGTTSITISALDGNKPSLRICERIVSEFQKHSHIMIKFRPLYMTIDDLYDLSLMKNVMTSEYDIVLSFKAVCEFITKARFKDKNAYKQFVQAFISKMNNSPFPTQDTLMI